MLTADKRLYLFADMLALLAIKEATFRDWLNRGIIRCTSGMTRGIGGPMQFSFRDLQHAHVCINLRRNGLSVGIVKKVSDLLYGSNLSSQRPVLVIQDGTPRLMSVAEARRITAIMPCPCVNLTGAVARLMQDVENQCAEFAAAGNN